MVKATSDAHRVWEPTMASLHPSPAGSTTGLSGEPPDLLALTDLKWVMSAYVECIDTARLVREPAYARRCLEAACATPSELVRRLAARVLSPLI